MSEKKKIEVRKKNRTVTDQHGHSYELTGSIGEGGQGMVCTTNYPNVLVKVGRAASEEKRVSWMNKIRTLMLQPLDGLPIAHPLALITQPQPGYVMELMDGLSPFSSLMQSVEERMREASEQNEEVVEGSMNEQERSAYLAMGGLKRRLQLLGRLARVLADLHSRGLVYGDLSPSNVFVSNSLEYAEVWLIDSDNITTQSRDGLQGVFTPDYGAPEILRGESGINTLTDSWSFAVIAYRVLTLAHPLKGDSVLEGDPEYEKVALCGELPWVDHPTNHSNALSIGLPREIILSAPLRKLFERCFNLGLNSPGERPSLSEWADAIEAASGHCDHCESCDSTFFYNQMKTCPFCGHVQVGEHSIVLTEYRYIPPALLREGLPDDIPDSLIQEECWTRTGQSLVLNRNPLELRALTLGAALYANSNLICTLQLKEGDLWIEPAGNAEICLQKASDSKVVALLRKQRLKAEKKLNVSFWLHLGSVEQEHVVWRFKW